MALLIPFACITQAPTGSAMDHVAVVLSPTCGVFVHYVPLERGPGGEMS